MFGQPHTGLLECCVPGVAGQIEIAVTRQRQLKNRVGFTGECGDAQKDRPARAADERERLSERLQHERAVRVLGVEVGVEGLGRRSADVEKPNGTCGSGGSGHKGVESRSGDESGGARGNQDDKTVRHVVTLARVRTNGKPKPHSRLEFRHAAGYSKTHEEKTGQ